MILETKAVKLMQIYFYICKRFEKDLKYCCKRYSNNDKQELTDQEIMTIYLYTIHEEQRFKIKQIHRFANEYLLSWFPNLGSYAAFNNRLNRLSEAFKQLVLPLLDEFQPKDCCLDQSLLDSMPIITCSGKRSPKVATELVNKGVCSSKGMYYNGLKLHVLGFRRIDKLPFPEQMLITPASVNDLYGLQYPFVPLNHTISDIVLGNGEERCYDAVNILTVAGNGTTVHIHSGSELTLIAGEKIIIKPGFTANQGSYVDAHITTDGSYCNIIMQPQLPNEKIPPPQEPDIIIIEGKTADNPILVYPNPSSGLITIDMPETLIYENYRIEVYDYLGRLVKKKNIHDRQEYIDLSMNQNGMYFIIIRNTESIFRIKVIKM